MARYHFIDLFFPRICLACGARLDEEMTAADDSWQGEYLLCGKCRADMPLTRFWKLRENPMAETFNELIQRNMDEDAKYQPYACATALFFYKGGYREITKSLKYRRNFAAGKFFGRELGKVLKRSPLFADVDLVVPVPLHWLRRWRRGYNQAEVIAREVAKMLGARCNTRILVRARRTKTQTLLDATGRARNVSGAFRVRRFPFAAGGHAEATTPPALHHILLIDDVFTTGATLAACERAIRAAAPDNKHLRISAATLACVEK